MPEDIVESFNGRDRVFVEHITDHISVTGRRQLDNSVVLYRLLEDETTESNSGA